MQYASALLDRPQEHPIRSLATLYLLWKSLLLLVAACSPGPGYDTSASLTQQPLSYDRELPLALRYILTKLTRWDALYFVKISTRGYLFEQEWAFGWGFTRIISAFTAGPATSSHDLSILISGICFGIATTFRSNGILNGLLLLEEAFRTVYRLRDGPSLATVRRLMATGLGGMSVGAGFVVPQYIAYIEYCKGQQSVARIWCEGTLPSIYTFVQDHYWNCGFFRYWTLSNAPLFLLAAPILVILIASSLWALSVEPQTPGQPPAPGAKGVDINTGARQVLRNLAVSQLVLVLLTTTAAHVQIITRISSAYPVWLWYGSASSMVGGNLLGENFVKFMIIYAMIQGGLFASFLPPA
ncbi:GPI mannosyltransferase 2 [Drepanopeziza brunnea f. sp. 'multigermtubi' MB_m1]|uniref:GPI mannosyltransferase 2 n=1 Tax=Marssonina brunnea f. sp. multigermtubi (strain MB_m1) TaxID=1072389 RepID=K1Y3Z5_MARBU|nr:GPI mannosyltransferase 2 [Drepanopeziza brunnea f. sp. 'multigermtubi' MB_m1]EKD19904.1 GPI mannosyltransferase 2 [Drepanopeziza brunnea f. sp. 'multigermtubi' MB_m1]